MERNDEWFGFPTMMDVSIRIMQKAIDAAGDGRRRGAAYSHHLVGQEPAPSSVEELAATVKSERESSR